MSKETGIGLVKKRERYHKLISVFPDRKEFYLQKMEELNSKIKLAKVCRRCGRPLSDEAAMELGYGKECAAKAELEATASEE